MKNEFERLIGEEITDEEYEVVETVYMYYSEKLTKHDIAKLWRMDKKIIEDMYPRAAKIKTLYEQITSLKAKIKELEEEMKELQQ